LLLIVPVIRSCFARRRVRLVRKERRDVSS